MFLFHFHEPQAVNGGEGTMEVFSCLLVGQMFHRRMRCLLFQCSSYHIHERLGNQTTGQGLAIEADRRSFSGS
jgi:hypothetical protein